MRWLKLADDGAVAREVALARQDVAAIALDLLQAEQSPHADALRRDHETPVPPEGHALTLRVISAKRGRLLDLRRRAVIGDNAYHMLEEELDWAEGHTNRRLRSAATNPDM